jgi:hypothetical protein
MFSVVDQFGVLWDVLSDSDHVDDAERTVSRLEYGGDNPIFLIFYWHGDEGRLTRRLSIVADAHELRTVISSYSFINKAGIDRVLIVLPERMTNVVGWTVETLKKAMLVVDGSTQHVGYNYETKTGKYYDGLPGDKGCLESYMLYSSAKEV